MGWTFRAGQTKQELICRLTETSDGTKALHKTIAHCLRGNVLWSVVEVTAKENLGWLTAGETGRFIRCDLLEGGHEGWGYKDMCESMGPYFYTCPLSYLNMAPVANLEWRERVYAHHGKPPEMARLSLPSITAPPVAESLQLSFFQ